MNVAPSQTLTVIVKNCKIKKKWNKWSGNPSGYLAVGKEDKTAAYDNPDKAGLTSHLKFLAGFSQFQPKHSQ